MTVYAVWMHNIGHRGAFASHRQRIITAEDPEKLRRKFNASTDEVVELKTVDVDTWWAEGRLPPLDTPTPEEQQ